MSGKLQFRFQNNTCEGSSFNLLFPLQTSYLTTQLHSLYQLSKALLPQPWVLIAQQFWNSSTPCPLPYGLTRAKDIVFTSPGQGSAKHRIKPLHSSSIPRNWISIRDCGLREMTHHIALKPHVRKGNAIRHLSALCDREEATI